VSRTRIVLSLVLTCLVAALSAQAATASPSILKGLYDETQTLYGNPDRTFPLLQQLNTKAIRMNLYWGGEFGVASRRPANPTNPNDPAYDWGLYDRAVHYASQYGMQVVFSIYGTPGWANRFRGIRYAPLNFRDLQNFAYAAARRYNGNFVGDDGRGLPRVRYWLAWNEPNNPAFLLPQYTTRGGRAVIVSAQNYAKICNAVVTGVKLTLSRVVKVGCGVTAPRGNNNPNTTRPSVSPLPFLRALKTYGMTRRFDAYAHHPYYGNRRETPAAKPTTKNAVILGNIGDLDREVRRLFGTKRLWITEYGYQTAPERVPNFRVTNAEQARYMGQAWAIAKRHPRIDMFLWFMLRDDRNLSLGWQSGLMTAGGARKPAFNTFRSLR
jgi:Glycosyl hydrolase catalytic core